LTAASKAGSVRPSMRTEGGMTMIGRTHAILATFLAAALVAGCGGGKGGESASEKAAAPAAGGAGGANTEALVKYYRKKANVPPAQPVAVSAVKDASVPGLKEGTLQIGAPPQVRNVPFTMSNDGRYVIFAAAEDVTVDPSKAVMAKIDLKDEPFRGPSDAKVTIVEYSDYQCPFCARGYNTLEQQVLKEYGDKVKFYFKDFPLGFHPWAEPAAIAAECAKKQKVEAFWKVYDWYFQNQSQVNPQNVKEKAWAVAEPLGLDKAKFDTCYDTKETQAEVKADMAEGQSLGVTGTPSFVVNGRLLVGAQPFEQLKAVIDDELASAK
jgi:protein-disulfide isomerase